MSRSKIVYGAGTPMVLSGDLSELADYPSNEVRIFVDAARCDPHQLLELVDGMSHEPLISKMRSIGAVESKTSLKHVRMFDYADVSRRFIVPIQPELHDYRETLLEAIFRLSYSIGVPMINLIVELRRMNG